jgi:hypothetical protein
MTNLKEFRERHSDTDTWKQVYGRLNKDATKDILTALVFLYMMTSGKSEDDAIKMLRADAQRMKQP